MYRNINRNKKPSILFLTKYPYKGASSRYRVYQYLPYFREAGIQFRVLPFHNSNYLQKVYKKEKVSLVYYMQRIMVRIFYVFIFSFFYKIIFVQKSFFPIDFFSFVSMFFLKKMGKIIIFDIDDAIWVRDKPLSTDAKTMIKLADLIIVGNKFLYSYCYRFNKNIVIVPTAINLEKYELSDRDVINRNGPIILGWIGTPITADLYLPIIAEAIDTISMRYNVILKLIGAKSNIKKLFKCKVVTVPWDEDTEVKELLEINIGLMPLDNSEFSKGKCGLKLLQYMAMGIPSVASPVGVNKNIIKDGMNGFLASSSEEWINKISLLIENKNLYTNISKNARTTVERDFSLKKWADKMIKIFWEFFSEDTVKRGLK